MTRIQLTLPTNHMLEAGDFVKMTPGGWSIVERSTATTLELRKPGRVELWRHHVRTFWGSVKGKFWLWGIGR